MINIKRHERDGSYKFSSGFSYYTHSELLGYLVNGVRLCVRNKSGDDVTAESLAYIINNRFAGRPGIRDAILRGFRRYFKDGVHNETG